MLIIGLLFGLRDMKCCMYLGEGGFFLYKYFRYWDIIMIILFLVCLLIDEIYGFGKGLKIIIIKKGKKLMKSEKIIILKKVLFN